MVVVLCESKAVYLLYSVKYRPLKFSSIVFTFWRDCNFESDRVRQVMIEKLNNIL